MVAVQGTQIFTNPIGIITDIDLLQIKTDLCLSSNLNDGCLIHKGFFGAFEDAASVVVPAVKAAAQAHPDFRVVVTGHSLGAAVSALLGAALRNTGLTVDIVSHISEMIILNLADKTTQYTFGQPKLGNADISNFIQDQAPSQGNNFRVTHFNDVVPKLPKHSWGGNAWDHYYPEFWINKEDGIVVATSDMKVVEGRLFETGGNEGTRSSFGFFGDLIKGGLAAHKDYFLKISSCSSEDPSQPLADSASGTTHI